MSVFSLNVEKNGAIQEGDTKFRSKCFLCPCHYQLHRMNQIVFYNVMALRLVLDRVDEI